jgi:hypothetical protein
MYQKSRILPSSLLDPLYLDFSKVTKKEHFFILKETKLERTLLFPVYGQNTPVKEMPIKSHCSRSNASTIDADNASVDDAFDKKRISS